MFYMFCSIHKYVNGLNNETVKLYWISIYETTLFAIFSPFHNITQCWRFKYMMKLTSKSQEKIIVWGKIRKKSYWSMWDRILNIEYNCFLIQRKIKKCIFSIKIKLKCYTVVAAGTSLAAESSLSSKNDCQQHIQKKPHTTKAIIT